MREPKRNLWILVCAIVSIGCDPPERATEHTAPERVSPAVIARSSVEEATPPIEPEVVSDAPLTPAITSFLPKFDAISAMGFVPTLRSGSTGIGYTLETMLEVEENNSPGGDFMGMELKAFRDDDLTMNDSEKMNLFLKEPKWIDGLRAADRVRSYGYVDSNGRRALYSTVTIETNSHKLGFEVEADSSRVWMTFAGERIAFWEREILTHRLLEKHSETVFVSAHARGKGKVEEFHYYGVTWCRQPSVDEFISLLKEGDVMLELRMHLKESGSVRNHGSCFRIKQCRIKDLFSFSEQVRP